MGKKLELDCTLEHETRDAVKVSTDVSSDVWVPKSVCSYEKDDPNEDMPCRGILIISEHWAIEKDLV
jgi:hypothetical protein